jgi:hypothetical protein|tara:strand:- start:33166 stop:33384 length:219 start_codon:yes stop_codon:yes gene_type:complete
MIYSSGRFARLGIIFLKELKMMLLVILATIVAALLAYSLFKDTGKNTKHARKGANAIAQTSSLGAGEVAEVN